MRLTADVVMERLQKKMKVSSCGNLSGRSIFGRPLLYEKGKNIRKGHFYVTDCAEIKEADFYGENICFILIGKKEEKTLVEELSYILVETKESLFSVLNEVQQIFDYMEEWKEALEAVCNRASTLEEILKISEMVFENPLYVMGTDFTLKANSGLVSFPEEMDIFSPGSVKMEYVNALKQDELYNQMLESHEVFLYPEYIIGYRSYNLNLWENDECRYRLVEMEYQKKLTKGDIYLLECMASFVRKMIYQKEEMPSEKNNTLRMVFERILTDRTADYMDISHQLSSFGWEPEAQYLCMVFQITYLDQRNLTANAICAYLEKNYVGACSFPYKEEIVTFFNLTYMEMDVDALESRLKYFIRESFVKAGYSWLMQGHGNLRRQYVQALLALDVGGRINPYLWIHHFKDVAFSYILEQSARRLPGYMLCHEKLRRLQESDEQQNTEYMKTLKVYLDQHLNAMQSAKELFIHRSTFLYRMDRIRKLLESELDDPEELLYLSFSFRLLEKEKRKK